MKIMKLLASCAMVGALTAVCASGAFAEVTGTITGISYTAEDATAGTSATVTFNIDNYNVAGGDYTVLVLNKNVDGSVISDDIVQIDQLTNTTTATNKTMSVSLVLPDDINNSEKKSADGTYYVRVGGAAVSTSNPKGYISTEFKVETSTGGDEGGEDPVVPETEAKMIGDFNADEDVNTNDMRLIAKCIAGTYEDFEEIDYYAASYADDDIELATNDMREIAAAIAGTGGERIYYYADLYYDENEEAYLIYGELYD